METDPEGTAAGFWWSALYTCHTQEHTSNLGKIKSSELIIAKLKML